MSVVFGCPACGKGMEGDAGGEGACGRCGAMASLPAAPERLEKCLVCGEALYRHRDFNQKLGILVIALGAGLCLLLRSFLPLVGAAAIDLLLYRLLPDVAICYACKAHHRDFPGLEKVPPFDLERHEHYRFRKAKAEGKE
jgi:hypothetical protein